MELYMSDDPALDAERYMRAMDIKLARRPKCHCCDRPIQDNEALHYTAKEFELWMCLECIDEKMELIEVD